MSKTMQQIVDEMGILMDDTNHTRFSEATKMAQANTEIGTTVSTFLQCYVREGEIQVHQGEYTYTFLGDMLDIVAINMDNISGERIIQRTYSEAARSDDIHRPFMLDTPSTWEPGNWSGRKTFIRDLNSDNQFRLNPSYDGGTYTENDGYPDEASEGDLLVDTGDDDAVYYCTGDYSGGNAVLTWMRTTEDVVFSAIEEGTVYIQVAVTDGGSTGVAALVITGTGVRNDPYVYTFTLYDDANSNNAVIALLEGDLVLEASGTSATVEDYTEFAATALTNPAENYFVPKVIHIRYTATMPMLSLITDSTHSSMPVLASRSNCIAQLAAAELMEMDPGSDKGITQAYRAKAYKTMADAMAHRNRAPQPTSVGPG